LFRYYLSQQLHPVVARLCDPLEGTDASRLALCLGLDPNDYKSSGGGGMDSAEAERNAWRSEEERFRDCQKLKVNINPRKNYIIIYDNVIHTLRHFH